MVLEQILLFLGLAGQNILERQMFITYLGPFVVLEEIDRGPGKQMRYMKQGQEYFSGCPKMLLRKSIFLSSFYAYLASFVVLEETVWCPGE